tara:strand:- start:34 stop:504 length:471 start_codon:yes stop_codon:yes gene_type:complete
MKINLMWGNGSPLSGYTNIDPHSYDKEGVLNSDITDLDDVVENSEATEILVSDVIDYLPKGVVSKAIGHWVSKLRHKGRIVIGGHDIYEISKIISQQGVSAEEISEVLHGKQNNPWEFKASHTTASNLAETLEQHGLKVLKKRVSGFKMIVEAIRP